MNDQIKEAAEKRFPIDYERMDSAQCGAVRDKRYGFIAGAEYALSEKEEEWISVETRLPDNGQAVLVWQNNLSDKECSRLQKAIFLSAGAFKLYPSVHSTIFKKDNGYKNYDLEGDMCEITHWMPLPSPPKPK